MSVRHAEMRVVGPYDCRDAENAESSHRNGIYSLTNAECHRNCQSLDELIKVGHYT